MYSQFCYWHVFQLQLRFLQFLRTQPDPSFDISVAAILNFDSTIV